MDETHSSNVSRGTLKKFERRSSAWNRSAMTLSWEYVSLQRHNNPWREKGREAAIAWQRSDKALRRETLLPSDRATIRSTAVGSTLLRLVPWMRDEIVDCRKITIARRYRRVLAPPLNTQSSHWHAIPTSWRTRVELPRQCNTDNLQNNESLCCCFTWLFRWSWNSCRCSRKQKKKKRERKGTSVVASTKGDDDVRTSLRKCLINDRRSTNRELLVKLRKNERRWRIFCYPLIHRHVESCPDCSFRMYENTIKNWRSTFYIYIYNYN